jgi:hypothetical protein
MVLRDLRPSPLSLIEFTPMVSLSAKVDYSTFYFLLFLGDATPKPILPTRRMVGMKYANAWI